jgi:hypothetical protein
MHERNIARPRMPICHVIKISDHSKCWSGESRPCWAAVCRAPEFRPEFHDIITMQERGATSDRWHRRQVLHVVTSSVVCHSLFVTSRKSDLNSGALETAEQSKGMQRYEFCLKSALKLLILGWVVVYDKYKTALVSDPRHRIALIDFLRPESPRPAVSGFQGWRKSTHAIRHSCGFLIIHSRDGSDWFRATMSGVQEE